MIKIPPAFIESTFQQKGIRYKHNARTNTFQIFNPFIDDTDYHMGLNYAKQVYHCFKTGQAGTLFDFFMKLLGMHEIELAKKIGQYDYEPVKITAEKTAVDIKPVKQPENWILIDGLPTSDIKAKHFQYLLSRNIRAETILRNKFFFSATDIWRVIIPYYIHNRLVYWIARDITGKQKKRYIYPTTDICPNISSNLVYNYDHCDKEHLYICEGQFNALIVNGIAVGGSNLSAMQLQLIRTLAPKKITLAFDQDMPGKNAMVKAITSLWSYFKELHYVDSPITKEDFSDLGEEKAREFIATYSKPYDRRILITEVNNLLEK